MKTRNGMPDMLATTCAAEHNPEDEKRKPDEMSGRLVLACEAAVTYQGSQSSSSPSSLLA